MTPLATRFAHELALPAAKRTVDDRANVLSLIDKDLHCFEVSAISKPVQDAMDEENLWPEIETMAPRCFLPSPVTWLEMAVRDRDFRMAWVLQSEGGGFRLSMVGEGPKNPYSIPLCTFRARSVLEVGERIEQIDLTEGAFNEAYEDGFKIGAQSVFEQARTNTREALDARIGLLEFERDKMMRKVDFYDSVLKAAPVAKHGIAFAVLLLDLINTPGLIGLRQHDPHRGLARKLYAARGGSYPLRGWSEVVLKHQTRFAGDTEHPTGATFHKCLHFVRSHLRHYRDGKVTVIPAHWRGDPALGIKRTRYMVAA